MTTANDGTWVPMDVAVAAWNESPVFPAFAAYGWYARDRQLRDLFDRAASKWRRFVDVSGRPLRTRPRVVAVVGGEQVALHVCRRGRLWRKKARKT